MLSLPVVVACRAEVPIAVLLLPVVLAWPERRPIKRLLVPLVRTSRSAVPVLVWTVKILVAFVISMTEIAEIVPLKLVVGVKLRAAVPVVVMTTVWVLVPVWPMAGALTPPRLAVTELISSVLPASWNWTW